MATSKITSDSIQDNAITSQKIQDNAITSQKIQDNAITSQKIQDNAITSQKIQDNAISDSKLASTLNLTGKSISMTDLNLDAGFGSAAIVYGVRAWVNFNGTGTVTVRESGNVSSVTDNGTGDYTVNFSTAMPDVNYCWSGSIKPGPAQDADGQVIENRDHARTTSTVRIITKEFSSDPIDPLIVQLSIIR